MAATYQFWRRNTQLKIVVTDAFLVGAGGISWKPLKELGDLYLYDDTSIHELPARVADADVIFSNRVPITEEIIAACPKLKLIGVFGTGVNHIDCEAAEKFHVAVCNVPGYGRGAVAQMAIALLLSIARNVLQFDTFMKREGWVNPMDPAVASIRQIELTGKTLGIIGMGNIGYAVAKIAMAMDMNVLAYQRHVDKTLECRQLKFVPLEELLHCSDVISLHCPLTKETFEIIDSHCISHMKDGVVLINVSRGKLLNTQDVVDALNAKKIYAVGIDTFDCEPCGKNHILASHPRCVATPHVAWAPLETRQHIVDVCADNLRSLLNNTPQNIQNRPDFPMVR